MYRGFRRSHLPTTFTSTFSGRFASPSSSTQAVGIIGTYSLNAPDQSVGNDLATLNNEGLLSANVTIDGDLLSRAELWLAAKTNESAQGQDNLNQQAEREGHRHTQKFVCNYLEYDQMIRNCSLQDADLVIYDVVYRAGVIPNMSSGNAAVGRADPLQNWEQGLLNEAGPGTQAVYAAARRNVLGTTPFQSTLFCKLYKIRKVTRVTLSAGEVHHHYVTVKPRNMFDSQTQNAKDRMAGVLGNTNSSIIPGLSGFTMVTAAGSIMNVPNDSVKVGTSQVALDWVTKCTGSFSSYTRERRWHLAFDNMYFGTDMQAPQDDAGVIIPDTHT